ncbi:MAG: hypothetical protein KIS29_10450 [Thermoplasmata archaeon]|nr:hypothetical protein [Candidatus Sysuiplasma jiujiangense]
MTYYKTTKRSGMSFHGETKYAVGKTIRKKRCADPKLCTSDVLHASEKALDALGYAGTLDCNLYIVEGDPVVNDHNKSGFFSLKVIREIPDQAKDGIFGFKYHETLHPVDPSTIESKVTDEDVSSLKAWASVRDSIGDSVWASVGASVGASVRDSVWDSVWASVRDSVWDSVWASVGASVRDSVGASVRDSVWASVRASVRDSVWDSVWASVGAYCGSLFPEVKKWKYIDHEDGKYPFQPAVDLWKRGFIPVKLNGKWKLYHPVKGKPAICVYDGKSVQ